MRRENIFVAAKEAIMKPKINRSKRKYRRNGEENQCEKAAESLAISQRNILKVIIGGGGSSMVIENHLASEKC
jgi:hypothetical protein